MSTAVAVIGTESGVTLTFAKEVQVLDFRSIFGHRRHWILSFRQCLAMAHFGDYSRPLFMSFKLYEQFLVVN